MKSLLLSKITGRISEKSFIGTILFYLFLSSFLGILGITEQQNSTLVFLWEVVSLVIISIYFLFKNRYFTNINPKLIWVFSAYFISQALITGGMAIGGENVLAFSIGTQLVPLIYLFVFLIVLGDFKLSPNGLSKLNLCFIFFGLFAAIYNIVINFANLSDFLSIQNSYDVMFSAFFSNRNTFGFVIAFSIMLLVMNWRAGMDVRWRIFYSSSLVILIASLILSMSRGSMVMLAVFLVLYFILYRGWIGLSRMIFILILLIIGVVGIVGVDFIIDNVIRPDYGSSGRDGIQEFGLTYFFSHNIFLGSGYTAPIDAVFDKFGYTSFHSVYVTILATGGLLLALFYSILIFFALKQIKKIRPQDKKIGSFFKAILFAYLIYAFIESVLPLRLGVASLVISLYVLFLPVYVVNFHKSDNNRKTNA